MSTMNRQPRKEPAILPSEVDGEPTFFDDFASTASTVASRAPFFAFCVLLIVVWFPTILFLNMDTWQLLINTATTIITFLMVALLQNSQTRSDLAVQQKLNALSEAIQVLLGQQAEDVKANREIESAIDELRQGVGIEQRESTSPGR